MVRPRTPSWERLRYTWGVNLRDVEDAVEKDINRHPRERINSTGLLGLLSKFDATTSFRDLMRLASGSIHNISINMREDSNYKQLYESLVGHLTVDMNYNGRVYLDNEYGSGVRSISITIHGKEQREGSVSLNVTDREQSFNLHRGVVSHLDALLLRFLSTGKVNIHRADCIRDAYTSGGERYAQLITKLAFKTAIKKVIVINRLTNLKRVRLALRRCLDQLKCLPPFKNFQGGALYWSSLKEFETLANSRDAGTFN